MRPERQVGGKTPAAGVAPAESAAGLGVTPAEIATLRKAVRSGNAKHVREVIDGYLARKGYHVWWEGLVLCAYSDEAKGVVRALRELFDAAGVDVEIVAWSSGGFGPVKIGIELPWGVEI